MNVACLLWETTDAGPDRIALRDGDRAWSYGAMTARASAIALALTMDGLERGDRVGILLPNGRDAAAAFYGAAAAGATVTLLNWLYRPRQVEQIITHASLRILLTSREWVARQARPLAGDLRVIFVEDLPEAGWVWPVDAAGDEPVQITYTSGSTGGPKGVVKSHDNLLAGVRTVVGYLGITPDDRIASLLPFSFVYGFNQLNCAVATGAILDIIDTPMAPEIVRALVRSESTVLAGIPPVWMQLLRVADFGEPIPSLRIMTCAGGRLSPEGVKALRAAQPQARLYLMYGLTEVFRSTYLPPEEVDEHPDSMGRAVPGSAVYVVRDDGSICDEGEVGELVHAGPTVALGYLNDPEATARVFRSNPTPDFTHPSLARAVYSGDLVRRDAAGRLYFVGRSDRMIKTLGFRVSPDEVADIISASGEVTEVVVTSEPDERRGERIVAHVVLAPEGTLEALRRWCGLELPKHMEPSRWDIRDALPRNASGKFDLAALSSSRSVGL